MRSYVDQHIGDNNAYYTTPSTLDHWATDSESDARNVAWHFNYIVTDRSENLLFPLFGREKKSSKPIWMISSVTINRVKMQTKTKLKATKLNKNKFMITVYLVTQHIIMWFSSVGTAYLKFHCVHYMHRRIEGILNINKWIDLRTTTKNIALYHYYCLITNFYVRP